MTELETNRFEAPRLVQIASTPGLQSLATAHLRDNLKPPKDLTPLPEELYVQGELQPGQPNVSVVGSRRVSEASLKAAYWIGEYLAKLNTTVVSGLALGVDSQAHMGALRGRVDTGSGSTIAVLPGSLSDIVPTSNRPLAAEILLEGGALLSEYAPRESQVVAKYQYLERNRLIAAMSEVFVVVEAEENGGAHKAARLAYAFGKHIVLWQTTGQTAAWAAVSDNIYSRIHERHPGQVTRTGDLEDLKRLLGK